MQDQKLISCLQVQAWKQCSHHWRLLSPTSPMDRQHSSPQVLLRHFQGSILYIVRTKARNITEIVRFMQYSRTTPSPCHWHKEGNTGLKSLFVNIRAVPPHERSHWEKLQCMVRTGWITPVIFSLGCQRKHSFKKKTRVTVCISYRIFQLWKMYFHLHLSVSFWVTVLILMPSGWSRQTVLHQCHQKGGVSLRNGMAGKAENSGMP